MHHKVRHVLGGAFVLPRATLHAAVLPSVFAINAPAAADRIAQGLGTANALDGVSALYDHTGSRRPLRDLGLSREAFLPCRQRSGRCFLHPPRDR